LGVGKDAEFKSAFWKARSKLSDCGFQPFTSGRIVILRKDAKRSQTTLRAWSKVGAEKEKIFRSEKTGDSFKKGKWGEIGKNAEESDENWSLTGL
jgi:hypothetical protein